MPTTTGSTPIYSSRGAAWVQKDGPNTEAEYIGCLDVDAIAESGGGIDTLLRCFNPDGTGWLTIGATRTPPDPVSTTLTALVYKTQAALEQIKGCAFNFFITQSETGRRDSFENYVRTWILQNAYVGDKGASNLAMRETDAQSEMTFGITAFPPVLRIWKKATTRQSVSLAAAANAIAFLDDVRCLSGSGPAQRAGKIGFLAGDTGTGSPSGTVDVMYTTDYGQTWTATSADPFAASEIVAALAVFSVGANTRRVVAARGTTDAGNPAEIAYSDDDGVTWTNVDVGSTVGQFVQTSPAGMFALDQRDLWLVTDGGYVYHSDDGALTWETQDAGIATSSNLFAIHFADNRVGFAGGASDAVIRTIDGGTSWSVVSAPGASSTITAIFTLDAQRAWVGMLNGSLYYTEDAGTTWTRRRFSGDTAGRIHDLKFVNELVGFMIHDTAAPVGRMFVTMDGGYSWELVTTTTNSGLNALAVLDENNFYAVGEVNSGTAALIKAQPQA